MVIIPFGSSINIEIARVKVYQLQFYCMLVISHVIILLSLLIEIDVIVTEHIRKRWTNVTPWLYGEVSSCHNSLSQSQREIYMSGNTSTQREISIGLQCHHLFIVETQSQIHLVIFLRSCRKCYNHLVFVSIWINSKSVLGRLIEKIHTNGSSHQVSKVCIDNIAFVQTKLTM